MADIKGRVRLVTWNAPAEKIMCRGCRTSMNSSFYWPSFSPFGKLYTDLHNHRCSVLCKDCTRELYVKMLADNNGDVNTTIMQLCIMHNFYWDPVLLDQLTSDPSAGYILPDDYFIRVAGTWSKAPLDTYRGRTFFQQIQEGFGGDPDAIKTEAPEYELTQADKDNRQAILSVFLHDPFEEMPARKRADLYRSLSLMIDPSMTNDFVRQQAAITVVKSFDQLRTIEQTIERLMADPVSNADAIEQLNKMKSEQNRTVSTFCKDNGFSEKYAANKSKGAQTLGGQMREMETMGYDAEKVNLYDIKTSKSIQQVAELSIQAITKQLALGDGDYVGMIQEQADYIRKLEKKCDDLEEANRLLKATQVKQELLLALRREFKEKGMSYAEIDEVLDKEYRTPPGGYPKTEDELVIEAEPIQEDNKDSIDDDISIQQDNG